MNQGHIKAGSIGLLSVLLSYFTVEFIGFKLFSTVWWMYIITIGICCLVWAFIINIGYIQVREVIDELRNG